MTGSMPVLTGMSGTGTSPVLAEVERIRADREAYEPLLRRGADLVIDTSTAPLEDVVDRIDALSTTRGGDR